MTEAEPRLTWRWGTAYDMFISLCVLHRPSFHGVSAQWAAGVRSRLPPRDRETLELSSSFFMEPPCTWISALHHPCHARAVLEAMEGLPPADRLGALYLGAGIHPRVAEVLGDVSGRRQWNENDRRMIEEAFRRTPFGRPPASLDRLLTCWADPEEYGTRYLTALQSYYQAFFEEEEGRLRPLLQQALVDARESAVRLHGLDLLEALSEGVRLEVLTDAAEFVLVPSFWIAPFTLYSPLTGGSTPRRWIYIFGARPADTSLIPGGLVPDPLLGSLRALSDPTRLRILRLLLDEPLTASQLSHRLRLRAPTVLHHLKALRSSGLVRSIYDVKGTRRFATRPEGIAAVSAALAAFVGEVDDPDHS